jgi:uncharacterized membrane protein
MMQEDIGGNQGATSGPDLEGIWEFAGQQLRPNDFTTAMVHFYRGEVSRSNTWRSRLDMTTNWAVVATGAALSFTYSDPDNTHLVILINTLLVLLFLFIEARRYRYYELWAYRVRLMETNFIAGLLSPPFRPTTEWAEKITASLKRPAFPISLGEAFGRRYRRNYVMLFLILAAAWLLKVLIHPQPADTFAELLANATTGPIPGSTMLLAGAVFNGLLLLVGYGTIGLTQTTSEVLAAAEERERLHRMGQRVRHAFWEIFEMDVPLLSRLPHLPESKQLAYIITDKEEAVSRAVIEELGRGVTRIEGQGMYTGEKHGVLMTAFKATEADRIRQIIRRVDPEAFVIITGVQDVRGEGFRPLEA